MAKENENQDWMDKVLTKRGMLVVTVVSFTVAIISYFNGPNSANKEDLLILKEQIINLRDNHIHTIEKTQERMEGRLDEIEQSITRLETVINERIPAKNL